MAKFDYYAALEAFATDLHRALQLACTMHAKEQKDALRSLRIECDKRLCSMENILFCDFLPPLERDNIAAYAHCMLHTLEETIEHAALERGALGQTAEEACCIRMASELKSCTAMLRRIRTPGELPDVRLFRNLLQQAREAHASDIARVGHGTLPKSASRIILSTGRLRLELSRCFDELIEVMLHNI